MPMLVVLDTNVLVSALLKEDGISNKALRLILARQVRLALDERIWDEYEKVTLRPALRIRPETRIARLSALRLISVFCSAQPLDIPDHEVPDSKDLPFAEVAVASRAQFLVTGNRKHFGFLQRFDIPVLSPAEFIENIPEKMEE
jgi:putative PIN family toxin of toxin-antitoxin system